MLVVVMYRAENRRSRRRKRGEGEGDSKDDVLSDILKNIGGIPVWLELRILCHAAGIQEREAEDPFRLAKGAFTNHNSR